MCQSLEMKSVYVPGKKAWRRWIKCRQFFGGEIMKENKLGLFSVISTGIGLVVATSCLLSLCRGTSSIGTMFIVSIMAACLLNMTTAASLAELNALMPKLTGGLAQYTLAGLGPSITLVSMVGGYLICNALAAPASSFFLVNPVKKANIQI